MVRPIIYPDAENLIRQKKENKFNEARQSTAADNNNPQEEGSSSSTNTPQISRKRNRGQVKKDTPEVLSNKKKARKDRRKELVESSTGSICESCGQAGHNTARSRECENYNPTLEDEALNGLGLNYERYVISLCLQSFVIENQHYEGVRDKVVLLSSFLRQVLFKAQVFVNFYIISNNNNDLIRPDKNVIFERNFWYTICRLIYGKLSIEQVQQRYGNKLPNLEQAYNKLTNDHRCDMMVPLNGLQNYGQVVSTACQTLATTYNNYYVENFERIIANYFINNIKNNYDNFPMATIKKVVYDFCLERTLQDVEIENDQLFNELMSNESVMEGDDNLIQEFRRFVYGICIPIKNRIPTLPLNKAKLTSKPLSILPVFNYILNSYTDNQDASPRRFSLFPNPSCKWRFIKIDLQNVASFFPSAGKPRQQQGESSLNFTRRLFFNYFDFTKLKIRSLEELIDLPNTRNRMFLNCIYTDGCTVRVSFGRRKKVQPSEINQIKLDISDFNTEEIDTYFSPVTVDPGRKDVFVSYHNNNDVRSLSTKEYYNASGCVNRMRKEDERKIEEGIKEVETNIPSPKTRSEDEYVLHVQYMLQNLPHLFQFYSFRVASINWKNWRGKQKALDECTNILIHGSKKYNKAKRRKKKTRMNRKRRKKMMNRRNPGISHQTVELRRTHKIKFEARDPTKMPLIIFGDGLKNKSAVKFKGLRTGASNVIYKHLLLKERLGEVCLLDIDEFRTSKVCHGCNTMNLQNFRTSLHSIHQILICNNCNIFWNRDVMAAKNMMYICKQIWDGGERPTVFARNTQSATTNVVVPHHGERT